MDKRKSNGGHSTKGFAGRKPKAEELKIIEKMDNIGDSEEILASLYALAERGNIHAIKLWLSYRYGMPKQTIDQHNTHEFPQVVWNEIKTYDSGSK